MVEIMYDTGSDNPKEVSRVTFSVGGVTLRLKDGGIAWIPFEAIVE